jgi:transcriptional regulator with XRE-family HTH domain
VSQLEPYLVELGDREFRDAYVDEHVRSTLAYQLRYLRRKRGLSQKQLAVILARSESVVSRLENATHGKLSVQTLLDIARKLDIALIVRFASFPEFLLSYSDVSPEALAVDNYTESEEKTNINAHLAEAALATSIPN